MREEGIKIIENFIIKDEPKNTSGKERFCNGGT